jgi:hypothetical protein
MDHKAELAFAHYARAQVSRASKLVNQHFDDGSGSCQACQQAAPCAASDYGQALILHYGQFVLAESR